MNDLLGDALHGRKRHGSSTLLKSNKRKNNDLNDHRGKKIVNNSLISCPQSCCFCNHNQPILSVQKSFTSKSYCLLHYYTTKACRIDVNKIHLVGGDEDEELRTQLPFVQNMFSEAFTELQRQILDESTKTFEEMAKRENDPLSILLEPARKRKNNSVKDAKEKSMGKIANDEQEGGFLRQIQQKELSLMEQQSRRIEDDAMASFDKKDMSNLYKRRKTSAKSSWHLVMSKRSASPTKSIENPIDNIAIGKKCPSCSSRKVEIDANFTSRMDNVSKAQTWGAKRDNDVSTRLRCVECNMFWFEDE